MWGDRGLYRIQIGSSGASGREKKVSESHVGDCGRLLLKLIASI